MSQLSISGTVRRALGRTADALGAGVGVPAGEPCWGCGYRINLRAARPGSVTLSAVLASPGDPTPAWAHRRCRPSTVLAAAAFRAVRAPEVIRTVRCPMCWELPALMLNPGQVWCDNPDCGATMYALDMTPGEQLAAVHYIDMSAFAAVEEAAGIDPYEFRPPQRISTPADRARELEVRAQVHAWGCICGDGGDCPTCPPPPPPPPLG